MKTIEQEFQSFYLQCLSGEGIPDAMTQFLRASFYAGAAVSALQVGPTDPNAVVILKQCDAFADELVAVSEIKI